ncbi:hypothetical protein ACHAXS_013421 [Conticribra weissflogii]
MIKLNIVSFAKPLIVLTLALSSILPRAKAAFWQWSADVATPRKIKPMVTRPSGPTNITLVVVSRTELGVSWDPPLFDGGKPISKYLVEWDTDKYMTSSIASPSNPYDNNVDGPLVRSEVVSGDTKFRIAGLKEGQKYYVRVSAYGNGYSNAISSNPPYAIPAGTKPGFLSEISLNVATGSATADRLRLAWSAPKLDVNGFSALPSGCPDGETPPASPDAINAYRVRWDTHPSMLNAKVYDIPAVSGDGSPQRCCPTGSDGSCHIELGSEVQTISIKYPDSTINSGGNLFESGAIRIAYVGSQSKSILVETPVDGSNKIHVVNSPDLPLSSPIAVGDIIRVLGSPHLVSDVSGWPEYVILSTNYQSGRNQVSAENVLAYYATPPNSCFDVSDSGNSADNMRAHIAQNFDNSPFDESITVSKTTLTDVFENSDSTDTRVVGYEYHVTFTGQGFSSTASSGVDELMIVSGPSSPFVSVGQCGEPFVSNGVDISSKILLKQTTQMESTTFLPGEKYYVQMSGINANGEGPSSPSNPVTQTPRSQAGLAQNCRVYGVSTSSSSLKVEWEGTNPYHGELPSSYRIDLYDVDSGSTLPALSYKIENIDEDDKYSVTVESLDPGTRYRTIIIPVTEMGEGSPDWYGSFDPSGLLNDFRFSSLQNYLDRSCNAVPTCESESIECSEADSENYIITTRSIPPPPFVEVATYPTVSNANRFSSNSILVTFESLLNNGIVSTGDPTDKFLVEWSTTSSFLRNDDLSWSKEVNALYSDELRQNAFGEFLIDSLEMGTQYFVRVSAHNSAGYGARTNSIPVKPMTRPDPPYEPVLSAMSSEYIELLHPDYGLSDIALIGTSLLVSWKPPKVDTINGRPDEVGEGGDGVSSYLVEWSRTPWKDYIPTVYEIRLQTASGVGGFSAIGLLTGYFRITVTAFSEFAPLQESLISANIPVDSSDEMLKTIIENMPNVGEVKVHAADPFLWQITFLSEVGDIDMSIAINSIVDNTLAEGTVAMSKITPGSIPDNSAYGSHIISDLSELYINDSIYYVIRNLVPGMKTFVRVSAGNKVGLGPRRKTAPEFFSPRLQRPGTPTSLYTEDSPPYLSIHSPTSLMVHIGPPLFNGGSPLTSFFIEWDPSPTFDSSIVGDGSSFGSARTNAASNVCQSCVTSFNSETSSFSYDGSDVTVKLLIPQRVIVVFFDDDGEWYQFTVQSATANEIIVSNKHLRLSSLSNLQSHIHGIGSDLEILGKTYIIDGLTSGTSYFVRVSAENGEMGTGTSIATYPQKATPRGLPSPPESPSLTIVDKNSLNISWSRSDLASQTYKVERFLINSVASKTSNSFFGDQEVVEISSIGLGLTGGTFTLYFGDFPNNAVVYLGPVRVKRGYNFVETYADMSPLILRGEAVMIGDEVHHIHTANPISSSRLPLSETYSGKDADHVPLFTRSKSSPISYHASAEEMKNALEQMPHVNHVAVRREIDDSYINDGFKWVVTFLTNVGDQPDFFAETSKLIGTNPLGFITRSLIDGIPPNGYQSFIIDDPEATSYKLGNLQTGRPYYVRVASISDKGESLHIGTSPTYLAPGGIPEQISSPTMKSLDERTILLTFPSAATSNGAVINEYVIDLSTEPSFSNSSRIQHIPSNRVQRVITRAHTLPWTPTSTFSLSLGDFHGDFIIPIGYGTTVRVQNGGSVLERSTGTANLSSLVARGEYLLVGGHEYRVCLDVSDSVPYDESHLTLCSKNDALELATFLSDSSSNVIDELPVFMLDTSLGAAKSPSIGNNFIRTVDASGSSKDTRDRLRRGDLIRIGHPDTGETFRVSTDMSRDFTDSIIPIGSKDDPHTPASLSIESLVHSTYEVQSFAIRSSVDSVTLSPSASISSGYRMRFMTETTSITTGGGEKGCLRWDGSAAEIKAELEAMKGIDSVKVTKEEISSFVGGAGAGVKYFITFTGLNVRGNVPPLEIVDIGKNGCLDAHNSGGYFGQDLAPISVEQENIPFVPFYEVQTTVEIPYDAEAGDMKAAIEALSRAGSVDVSREINRHGFSWDVTFINTKDSLYSDLLVISANGENLSAGIDSGVSVVGVQQVEINTNSSGVPYFVRVAAANSFGLGPFTNSNPRAIQVSPQPPSEPIDIYAEPLSDTEILVQWNPPLETGGRQVTHYKIEYDELSSFTGGGYNGPTGSITLSSVKTKPVSDIQSVTVKIDSRGMKTSLFMSGSFSLEFDGQKTSQLPYNASPLEMKAALEALCTIDEVQVSRTIHCSPYPELGCMEPEGYTWLVTFVSPNRVGDQHNRRTSMLSPHVSHKLSIDGSHLFECTDERRSSCLIAGNAVADVETTQEIQSIVIASSSFSVTVGAETSDVIHLGDAISEVEEKLNKFDKNGVGKISITCPTCAGDTISSGDTIFLHFMSFRGDIPPVDVSDPGAFVNELVSGNSQFVVGRSSYSTIIPGLTSVKDWYVRIFAYNGIGGGRPGMAWPSPIRLSAVAPQAPENVKLEVDGTRSLRLSWDRPISIGGVDLISFIIEYDTIPSFKSRNGSPFGRLTPTEDECDTSIGLVSQSFPANADPILRKRMYLEDGRLVSDGIIGVNSEIYVENHRIIVSSINDEGCGVTCLTLNKDYPGTRTSGMKIYLSSPLRHYSFVVPNLIPGIPYYVRVAAVNEKAVSPFSFDGYPYEPLPETPMDVPSAPSWVSLSPVSAQKLRIDFGSILSEKAEGANGSPITKYHLEVATGKNEVQEVLISSSSSLEGTENNEFRLSFFGIETGCIKIGTSVEAMAESLGNINGVGEVSITKSYESNYSLKYIVEFSGLSVKHQNLPLIGIGDIDTCAKPLESGIDIHISSLQQGTAQFQPGIVALSTSADDLVSGHFELSVGFHGHFDMLVHSGNQPAIFNVEPGSRWMSTMGDDLTSDLHPGDIILIEEEFVEVQAVETDTIELVEYHSKGTKEGGAFGYRMDNYVGSATISPGDNSFVEANGRNVEKILKVGDMIQLRDSNERNQYVTVSSVDESNVIFSPPFNSEIVARTPVYAKKSVVVSAESSSTEMKTALESLPGVGVVSVSREGPKESEGFTWLITFLSTMGISSCSVQSWCLTSNIDTIRYVTVDGLGQGYDGSYVQSSFTDGRPRYELLWSSGHIAYDSSNSEWRLYSSSGSVISSVISSDVSPPLTGWTNSASLSPAVDATQLLFGSNAKSDISIIQVGVEQSYNDLVFSTDVDTIESEVQEVRVSCVDGHIAGSFNLSLNGNPGEVMIYVNDSIEDFTAKLESLPGVGHVRVQRTNPQNQHEIGWLVTFLSNSGDVPIMKNGGTSNLEGRSVSIDILEKRKGNAGPRSIMVDNLQTGASYSARIRAENAVGAGPYITSRNNQILRNLAIPPGSPELSYGVVTKSHAEVRFTEPVSNGSNILSYKFEWATSSSFGEPAQVRARVFCSDNSELLGHFRLVYGGNDAALSESSIPIEIRGTSNDVSQALNGLKLLRGISVSDDVDLLFLREWTITFAHDVGPAGTFSFDTSGLHCQDEESFVEATATTTFLGTIPDGYNSVEVYSDEMTCGSMNLGEFSSTQLLSLEAKDGPVTGGSFQMMFEGQSSECIQIDATDSDMKSKIEAFDNIHDVNVIVKENSDGSSFPFSFLIMLRGRYIYGDWPAFKLNTIHFGAGECDPFVGGTDHGASILPIRDESLCSNGIKKQVAIVVDSKTTPGGYFNIRLGQKISPEISVDSTAIEIENALSELLGQGIVEVNKHSHHDMGPGIAWSVTYASSNNSDEITVLDTHVTGKNAKVNAYPILSIQTHSPQKDSQGDYRIVIDGESTSPISHRATQKKVLQEIQYLRGIGKANMLGPAEGIALSSLDLDALIDDSFTVHGLKAIAIVGDLTSTVARGDDISIGMCTSLVVHDIIYESFDEFQSAGYLYKTLYPSSTKTALAEKLGYTIIIIDSDDGLSSLSSDCAQNDGVDERVSIGSVFFTSYGVDHSMVIKSFTYDLNDIAIEPERTWRGTSPRIFFKSPGGKEPRTFILNGIDSNKSYIVRASARNAEGYGLPSETLVLKPSATVPGAPRSVSLS